MKHGFIILLTAFYLASCNGGWTAEDKQNFITLCEENGRGNAGTSARKADCQCRLDETMKIYPAMNDLLENYDSTKLRIALERCK